MNSNLEKALGFNLKAFNYLYALCDYETLLKKNITLAKYLEILKKYDVKLLQYRDKVSNLEIQKENLIFLKKNLNIPIIINDKLDLIDYADGLHIGQEDFFSINKDENIAIKLLRAKVKNKLLGLSTHNELEILKANNLDFDMIGLGAYRATNTKDISNILEDKLSYLAKISKHPVCAIGGVKVEDIIENVRFNCVGSAILNEN